jgi:translation initiation factor 2A
MQASSVRLLWNATGSALLAETSSDVDATNQSYYGEQKLHFLASDGASDCLVPLAKEGPVHDVQWAPSGSHFVVVAGFMPAKTMLFDAKYAAQKPADAQTATHVLAWQEPACALPMVTPCSV